jgi:hypothetical protein
MSPADGRDHAGGLRPDLTRWPWLQRVLETSEANACLSLCGNHASTLNADAIGTTVECRVRCQDGFPLGPALDYEAVGVFGDDAGRAIAFRPLHDASRLVVAFRGVRVEREALKSHAAQPVRSRNRSMGSAVSDRGIDIKNMLGTQCASADWLPALDMRVHDGVMRHHDSFWSSRQCSRNERKTLGTQTVLPGDEAALEAASYLGEWLEHQTHATEILFVGLSLGAALAQISALRAVAEHPHLSHSIRVLALGTVQWADAATTRYYEQMFGDRSVQLVNTARATGPAPLHAGWWVSEPPTRAGSSASMFGTGSGCVGSLAGSSAGGSSCDTLFAEEEERYIVVDPLTAQLAPPFCLLHNVIPCVVPEPESNELARLDLEIAPAIKGVTAQLGTLSALMRGTLNSQHPMSFDYQRLHLGRNYRASLRDIFIRLRSDGAASRHAVGASAAFPPCLDVAVPMSISPRCSPRLLPTRSPRHSPRLAAREGSLLGPSQLGLPIRRSASLKRSLGMLPESDAMALADDGQTKRRVGEGLRSISSYPSRLSEARGDERLEGGVVVASRVRSYASLEALAASAAAAVAELAPLCHKGREAVSQAMASFSEIAMF